MKTNCGTACTMRSGAARRFAAALLVLALPALAFSQLPSRSEPLPGITTSGQPDAAALEQIAAEGFVAVVDLRGVDENRGLEEAELVESLGMRYVALPIAGADAVTFDNAAALDALLDGIDGRVLVHCSTGNRTGALLALRERLRGADAESALATGLEAGLTNPALRETVESRLGER